MGGVVFLLLSSFVLMSFYELATLVSVFAIAFLGTRTYVQARVWEQWVFFNYFENLE